MWSIMLTGVSVVCIPFRIKSRRTLTEVPSAFIISAMSNKILTACSNGNFMVFDAERNRFGKA